jgi:hypothetical protein
MARLRRSLCRRALIFRTGGISLKIAQRFNAGFSNEVKIESRRGRKNLSVIPMGLNKEKPMVPSVKTLGYFQFDRNI